MVFKFCVWMWMCVYDVYICEFKHKCATAQCEGQRKPQVCIGALYLFKTGSLLFARSVHQASWLASFPGSPVSAFSLVSSAGLWSLLGCCSWHHVSSGDFSSTALPTEPAPRLSEWFN